MCINESNNKIIYHLAMGDSHKEIACKLNMSINTLKKRLKSLRKQQGVKNDAALVFKMIAFNFLDFAAKT